MHNGKLHKPPPENLCNLPLDLRDGPRACAAARFSYFAHTAFFARFSAHTRLAPIFPKLLAPLPSHCNFYHTTHSRPSPQPLPSHGSTPPIRSAAHLTQKFICGIIKRYPLQFAVDAWLPLLSHCSAWFDLKKFLWYNEMGCPYRAAPPQQQIQSSPPFLTRKNF